jgi:hypothetical protein
MSKQLWVAVTIVFLFSPAPHAQQAGEVWAPPTVAELGETNQQFRAKSPDRYLISHGDFNGDGQQDRAAIVVRHSGAEAAVLIYLAGRTHGPLVLDTLRSATISQLGIQTVKPGTYQPACARGGGVNCDPGTRVTIPNDGVSIFTFEGPATYYWLEADQVRSMLAHA